MLLCLDIGNSHVYGGVFQNKEICFSFRFTSKENNTSDQIGVFLRHVIRENNFSPEHIKHIALCSVVPSLDYSIRAACIKYFDIHPFHLVTGVKTGLNIKIKNPRELGADRIANAVAAQAHYPQKNIIVCDFGTATTFCAIAKNKDYLGGIILPGLKISMEALHQNTAKLFPVNIIKPQSILGKTTAENIQSGLYFGNLGALKEIIKKIQDENFAKQETIIIGTGGFSHLFEKEGIFHVMIPDLVLHGIQLVFNMNEARDNI